jgi:glycosyltransferase involved in cell wall biosynthesis
MHKKTVKVVEFINSLADGGAETLVKDYATMADVSRFEFIVLALSKDEDTAVLKILEENDVRVICVYEKWNVATRIVHRLFGRIIVRKFLRNFLKNETPNVIHAHLQTLIYLGDVSDCLKGVRILYTCHNLPSHIFGDEHDKKFQVTKKLICQSGLQLIALHEDMAAEMNQMFAVDNTVVIKNGIDYNRFMNVSQGKKEIRKNLGIDVNAFVIGNVGRFTLQKNHDAILSIFEEFHRRNSQAVLLLVGTGELKEIYEKKVHNLKLDKSVVILSNRNDIPELNKAMDLFLFPSRWEGFGIALIEAQVAGVPCIASDVVPQTTKISNHIVYESLDASPAQWCDDIEQLIRQGVDMNSISHEYDMANEICKLEKLYER